jgi:hypothetical protein
MLFKVLKLFGLDVRAEIATVRGQIEERVEKLTARAKQTALTTAVIIALSSVAGLFCMLAIGVGLLALYRTATAAYGPDAALAILAAVLVAAALVLMAVAWMLGRSLSRGHPSASTEAPAAAAGPAATASAASTLQPDAVAATPSASAEDLLGPLAFVLALFAKDPKLGHPALDEFVGRTSAGGRADETVEQALNLVRNGDRTQLLTILGSAVLVGWLLARTRPTPARRDAAGTNEIP